jgi:acyl-coenzyme A synthetase/AMP-(fatty) acid ligase
MTAAEVEHKSAAAAARLAAAGIEPGDRVVMSCPPSADLVLAHVAPSGSGRSSFPSTPALGPSELGNVWNEARPKLAVLDDRRLPEAPSCPPSLTAYPPTVHRLCSMRADPTTRRCSCSPRHDRSAEGRS